MPRRRPALAANAGQPIATINAAWRRLLPGQGWGGGDDGPSLPGSSPAVRWYCGLTPRGLPLAVVSAEAEGVTGWVEEHSDVLLRLVRSHRCSECNRLGDRGV
jgi:hypothetical protein